MGQYFQRGRRRRGRHARQTRSRGVPLAASRLGADPRRSIVVEDAPTGIEAGRRAGMHTVGVSLLHTLPEADVYVVG